MAALAAYVPAGNRGRWALFVDSGPGTGVWGAHALGGFTAAGLWIFGGALLAGERWSALSHALCAAAGTVPRLALSVWPMVESPPFGGGGLVVAVGMVTGMLQMVGSFRGTIERWFEVRFQADLYVGARLGGAAAINGIAPEVLLE